MPDPATSPFGTFRRDLERLAASTDVLIAAAERLTDTQAHEPSLLPGWTRGHVLTHVARNADGMINLVRWARTGEVTPMYPSADARNADIEAGATRPAAALAADVRDSAARFRDAATRLGDTPEALQREIAQGVIGPTSRYVPAAGLPRIRRIEVEVHHGDLGTGYGPADWPDGFAADLLAVWAPRRSGPEGLAGIGTLAGDDGGRWALAPADGGRTLHGPSAWLAAWIMGRAVPDGVLTTSDGTPPPPAPSF